MDDSDGGNQIVICKVNPRDVVSVPSDSKFQKLRCCQYEVVAIFNDVFKSSVELMGQKIDGLKVARYDEAWKENVRVRLDTLVSSLRKRTQTAGA